MKVVTHVELSKEEKAKLSSCEKTIQAAISQPFEMGRALATINKKELFKETHSSFADYAESKWHLNKSGAYAKINAAKMADLVVSLKLTPLTNEAQALELNKIQGDENEKKADRVKAVWQKACKNRKRPPTAKLIKEIREEMYGKPKEPWYVRKLDSLQKEVANFRTKLRDEKPTLSPEQVNLFGSIVDEMDSLKKELDSLATRTDEAGKE